MTVMTKFLIVCAVAAIIAGRLFYAARRKADEAEGSAADLAMRGVGLMSVGAALLLWLPGVLHTPARSTIGLIVTIVLWIAGGAALLFGATALLGAARASD